MRHISLYTLCGAFIVSLTSDSRSYLYFFCYNVQFVMSAAVILLVCFVLASGSFLVLHFNSLVGGAFDWGWGGL